MLRRISTPLFDEFEEAMEGIRGRHVLMQRTQSSWDLDVLALGDVALMHGHNGARSVYQGTCDPGTCIVFVPLQDRAGVSLNGHGLEDGGLGVVPCGYENRVPSRTGLRWLTVSVRPAAFPQMRDDAPVLSPDVVFRAGPGDPHARDRLVRIVLDAFRVAIDNPETFAHPLARRSLQEQLVDATEQAVQGLRNEAGHAGRPRMDRGRLLDVALQVIREHADEPIHIRDLCTHCGVSAATLRDAFEEQLHIAPHQYLMLYRMHGIRRALMSRPNETVASVCGRFGVWEFGRFASHYRRQFGESPTETLRKSPAQKRPEPCSGIPALVVGGGGGN